MSLSLRRFLTNYEHFSSSQFYWYLNTASCHASFQYLVDHNLLWLFSAIIGGYFYFQLKYGELIIEVRKWKISLHWNEAQPPSRNIRLSIFFGLSESMSEQ